MAEILKMFIKPFAWLVVVGILLIAMWFYTTGIMTGKFPFKEYFSNYKITDESFTALSVGSKHVCALRPDGSVACWGDDHARETFPPESERFTAISSGYEYTCGLRHDGRAICWGREGWSAPDSKVVSPPEDGVFTSLSTGKNHACGLRADGVAVCWGRNEYKGHERDVTYSLDPPPGEKFVSIATSTRHSCGLREDGTVTCWGFLETYNSESDSYIDLVVPPEDKQFASITAGVCGVTRDKGGIYCWNDKIQKNFPGEEGVLTPADGETTCAIYPDGTTTCIEEYLKGVLALGDNAKCAIKADGTTTCLEEYLRCGFGSFTHCRQEPRYQQFTSVGRGNLFGCGLRKDDGRVACWVSLYSNSDNLLDVDGS